MSGDASTTDDAVVDEGTEEDFESGFGAGAATETPAAATTPEPVTPEPSPAPTPEPTAAPVAEAPKYVQLTEQELADLRTRAARGEELASSMGKRFDQVFGKVGALEQVISKLRTETPAGEKVEVSEEDFADLVKEYPDLVKMQVQGLNKALSKFKGMGGDPQALDEKIGQHLETARGAAKAETAEAMLNAVLPGWRKEVVTPAFAAWFNAQSKEVQDMQMSDDPVVSAQMLRRYDRDQTRAEIEALFRPKATPAPTKAPAASQKVNERQRQLAAAVPARGDGAAVPSTPKEEDPFEVGFKTGRT